MKTTTEIPQEEEWMIVKIIRLQCVLGTFFDHRDMDTQLPTQPNRLLFPASSTAVSFSCQFTHSKTGPTHHITGMSPGFHTLIPLFDRIEKKKKMGKLKKADVKGRQVFFLVRYRVRNLFFIEVK